MKDQIERYHELDPEERLRVELFVEENPEFRELLERQRRFAGALHRAGAERPELTEDDLARYVTTRRVTTRHVTTRHVTTRHAAKGGRVGDEPPHIQAENERIARLVAQDATVREQVQGYADRFDELQKAVDPLAHFESLSTGSESGRSEAGEPKLSYVTRPPQTPRRMPRVLGWSASIAAGIALLVATLVVVDTATTSELERESAFTSDELDRRQYTYTLRSNDVIAFTTADSLFLSALDALGSADRSFLGLFRSYDAASLAEAQRDLEDVIALENGDAFLALEARYLLAKVMIQKGRLSEADSYLRYVIEQGGARAERARSLLESIEETE